MTRLKVGSTRAALRASAVNLAYPEVRTNPTSSSVCDPSAASASGRISTSQLPPGPTRPATFWPASGWPTGGPSPPNYHP
ncbi:hypothetical protein PGTUg99_028807 [Puccinia graminis f. sp. tritici]|uniref:Uncharacterized protein n=1 Tax=Puccinia graminis f. sp. tritici TaxID=56615 RepID=A0A5B0RLS7_PUCGR|nr:hypothetical protein PGTUg99_028807 [Puccinia graminis f. sp. tritici]